MRRSAESSSPPCDVVTAIAGAALAFGTANALPGWDDDDDATDAGRPSVAGLNETCSRMLGEADRAAELPCRDVRRGGARGGMGMAPDEIPRSSFPRIAADVIPMVVK